MFVCFFGSYLKEKSQRECHLPKLDCVFKMIIIVFYFFMYFTQDKVHVKPYYEPDNSSKDAPKSINGTNKVQNKSQICHIVYICHKMNDSFKDAPFPHFPRIDTGTMSRVSAFVNLPRSF